VKSQATWQVELSFVEGKGAFQDSLCDGAGNAAAVFATLHHHGDGIFRLFRTAPSTQTRQLYLVCRDMWLEQCRFFPPPARCSSGREPPFRHLH